MRLHSKQGSFVLREKRPERERGELVRRLLVELGRAMPGATFEIRLLDELPIAIAGRVVTEGSVLEPPHRAGVVCGD